MNILAIETSCDETAIAVCDASGTKTHPSFRMLSNIVLSQIKTHEPFGGVVPNLAQREHQKNLVPILISALYQARFLSDKKTGIHRQKIKPRSVYDALSKILEREPILLKLFQKYIFPLNPPNINAIAVTHGPGLEPALWVGINFAKALATLWQKPLMPINHLEGHIYASWLDRPSSKDRHYPQFPLLALVVSGGHTELVLMKKHLDYKILGETRDDAVGEAFDKVAKMLKLGYPGGPLISKLAEKGNPYAIGFPRPMINSKDFDFSFSGLKTAVLYHLNKRGEQKRASARIKKNIAASFEQSVVDVLIAKTTKALRQYKVKTLVVGGGVAANKKLRFSLTKTVGERFPAIELYLSPAQFTGDNAAMIAAAAYFHSLKKKTIASRAIRANGNLKLTQ